MQALAPIDWNNWRYALTCDNIVQTPVNVAFSGDNATATGPGIGPYDQWDMSIEQVSHGVLLSLGNVTAVLFSCSPQPSNFSVQELRIYRTADGSEIDPGTPGQRRSSARRLQDGVRHDRERARQRGRDVLRLSAWNAAPAALRNSWAAAPITGFTNISCWNGWVVAVPVSPSPGNGEIVLSLAGNLHLITTTELQQQVTQEVCSCARHRLLRRAGRVAANLLHWGRPRAVRSCRRQSGPQEPALGLPGVVPLPVPAAREAPSGQCLSAAP